MDWKARGKMWESASRQSLIGGLVAAHRQRRAMGRFVRPARRAFAGLPIAVPEVKLAFTQSMSYGWDAEYHRTGASIELLLPAHNAAKVFSKARQLGSAYLYWLLAAPQDVRRMSVTLSDGDRPGLARFSPSTNRPDVVAIPDPYFFLHRGFADWRQQAERSNVAWEHRSDDIVWRGLHSGDGTFDPVLGALQPERAAARLRLCLALRDVPGTDVALSGFSGPDLTADVLRAHGILREPVPEASWLGRKFAIDIDGQTNTWSNLIVRLHLGCCVLKVGSAMGYRQWYYDRLKPWEHYVPVRPDLADLVERIDWARAHDAEARRIAAAGQALARSLTMEAVTREAADLVARYWQG